MKLVLKGLLSIALLASSLSVLSDGTCGDDKGCPVKSTCTECADPKGPVFGKTFFSYRPVHSNTARKMVAVEDKIHLFGKDEFYGVVDVALEYTQTFRPHRLAKYFSFKKDSTSMDYGQDCTSNAQDIFGRNFGTTATGTICFNPRIQNFIADIDLFLGWDEFICGLWTRLDIPIVHTRWDLRMSDTGNADGSFPAGIFDATANEIQAPYSNLKEAFVGDQGWGKVNKLEAGRINGRRTDTQVSGLTFTLGYDFIRKERGHVAAGIFFVAPTGTRPHGDYLFEPIVGANHSWQLGGTLNAAYRLWENCDCEQSLWLYFDAEVSHLFKAKQTRLLGLKDNGAGSSYLLLKKWNADGTAVELIERAANILNTKLKVGATVMADASLMLQYNSGCFFGSLGYNFWVRSKEKAKDVQIAFPEATYSIFSPIVPFTDECSFSDATIGLCGTQECGDDFVFLKRNDVDVCPALAPRAFTNKVFGSLGYNWKDCDWTPFLALFGEVEFAHENKAANQWGVGLKGGVAF